MTPEHQRAQHEANLRARARLDMIGGPLPARIRKARRLRLALELACLLALATLTTILLTT